MRYVLAALLLIASPALAEDAKPPAQWQYEESLEVPPGPLPRDRCLRATYGPEMQKERDARVQWWNAPIDDQTARWLALNRDQKRLTITFCDQGGDT